MRRAGRLLVLAWVASACGTDEADDGEGGILDGLWQATGELFDGAILWGGLFVLFVLIAAAALIVPATWLRNRSKRGAEEYWEDEGV